MSGIVGKGWAFPPKIGERDMMRMAEDDADIRQAIRIILGTAPGERVMRPEFGCRIHELIFWPANQATADIAERFVREALLRWEPRIRLQAVTVTPGGAQYGQLVVEIEYEIKTRNDKHNMVYPFYLTPQAE
ncbi:MAG: GPW/gp25 family protein [Anaerolineae bacterium]|nr:GPW/gp25 family protein [Anaerolineae bacterium]